MSATDNKTSERGQAPPGVTGRKPPWIRSRFVGGERYLRLRRIIDEHRLHTVCQSATCPNMGECWGCGTATLMILGDVCTRDCRFCHVDGGRPNGVDDDEPRRVAESVALMGLKYVVVTSVTRDDLPDGGAGVWAETIRAIREKCPDTAVEVLIPDFGGDSDALRVVADSRPTVLGHNMETVRNLYPAARPQADYDRSLELLRRAKEWGLTTKTGVMVGLGETDEQIERLMREVVSATGCDILTVGQYLQPSRAHLPVARWVKPEEFERLAELGKSAGFGHVEAGPLVRSSYHAAEQAAEVGGRG